LTDISFSLPGSLVSYQNSSAENRVQKVLSYY